MKGIYISCTSAVLLVVLLPGGEVSNACLICVRNAERPLWWLIIGAETSPRPISFVHLILQTPIDNVVLGVFNWRNNRRCRHGQSFCKCNFKTEQCTTHTLVSLWHSSSSELTCLYRADQAAVVFSMCINKMPFKQTGRLFLVSYRCRRCYYYSVSMTFFQPKSSRGLNDNNNTRNCLRVLCVCVYNATSREKITALL